MTFVSVLFEQTLYICIHFFTNDPGNEREIEYYIPEILLLKTNIINNDKK